MFNLLHHHSTKAFTLIELLVTVSIVGILASISVANYDEYKQKAYDAVVLTGTRNFYTALHASTTRVSAPDNVGVTAFFFPNSSTYFTYGSISSFAPGYVHTPGMYLAGGFIYASQKPRYAVVGMHCRGTGMPYGIDYGQTKFDMLRYADIGFYKSEDCAAYGY